MFGIGPAEMIIILVVAIIVVGPDRLPDAARAIGKGIRGLRKEADQLRETIEDDGEFGDAVRELRGALRGDYLDIKPKKQPPKLDQMQTPAADGDSAAAIASDESGTGDDISGDASGTDEAPPARTIAAVPDPAAAGADAADADAAEPAELADTATGDDPADPDLPIIKPAGHAARKPDAANG